MSTNKGTPILLDRVTTLAGDSDKLYERVTARTDECFLERGCVNGHDVDDWLRAVNELLLKPEVELRRQDRDFIVEMVLPETDPKDLQIRLTPREMLVISMPRDGRQIFRIVRFSEAVDCVAVHAGFAGNTLRIVAAIAHDGRMQAS